MNIQYEKSNEKYETNCYFNEIDDISTQSLSDVIKAKKKSNKKNCMFTQQEKIITIVSNGGQVFQVSLEQKIKRIFPLIEGLLIEFYNTQSPSFEDIQQWNKQKNQQQKQFQNFSYVTLNRHPYNPLKFLGILHKQDGKIYPWLMQSDEIVYVSQKIPLIVSYDIQHNSHSIRLIKFDKSEFLKNQEKTQFSTNFYQLNDLNENQEYFENFNLVSECFYEENTRENKISKCCEVKSNQLYGEFLLCALIQDSQPYVKLYSIIFCFQGNDNLYQQASIKVQAIFQNIFDIFPINICKKTNNQIYKYKKKLQKQEIQRYFDYKVMYKNIKKSHILFAFKNGNFQIYDGKQKILNYKISDLQEYNIDLKSIQIKHGIANLKFQDDDSLKLQIAPKLQNSLTILILQTIKEISFEIYQQFLSDTIKNCINNKSFIYNEENDQNEKQQNEFHNFLYYVIFVLKFCKRNGYNQNKNFSFSPTFEKKQKKIVENTQSFTNFDKMLQITQNNQYFTKQNELIKECKLNTEIKSQFQKNYKLPQITISLEKFNEKKIKIFRIIHLLYQDLKLNTFKTFEQNELLYFLFCYSQYLDHEFAYIYQDYYLRENSEILIRYKNDNVLKQLDSMVQENKFDIKMNDSNFLQNIKKEIFIEKDPPDIYKWLEQVIGQQMIQSMPIAFKLSKKLCKFVQILYSQDNTFNISDLLKEKASYSVSFLSKEIGKNKEFYPLLQSQFDIKDNKKWSFKNKEEKAFLYLIKNHITYENIQQFPYAFQIIIFNVFKNLRNNIPNFLLDNQFPKLAYKLIKRQDILKNIKRPKNKNNLNKYDLKKTIQNIIHGSLDQQEKMQFDQKNSKMNNDLIFKEIRRLLDSNQDMKVKAKYLQNIPDEKLETESQNLLQKYCVRRLSQFIGQGAFYFGIQNTFITELIQIPKINLSAIMPPFNQKMTIEIKDEKDQNIKIWGQFHNGVHTALKLSKSFLFVSSSHLRTWILYQRPETPTYEHGGFLFGLGLLGHLNPFLPTDIYLYLKQNHEATSVGILLGLAASRIGKVNKNIFKIDDATYKTFCLHIHYLLPQNYDVEIPLVVQTAALVGIGLLYKSTSNRLMTEMTLAQIGSRPMDKSQDRDSYSLAAGFSLGIINLGKGSQISQIKDLQLDERLIRFVEGGKMLDPPQSMLSCNFNAENKCSSIKENGINLHITAPAALLALSLMFLKSNNKQIADRIEIPYNFSTLENANPNLIVMKVICQNLIMWDKIQNTQQWIQNSIPPFINFIHERSIKEICERYFFVQNVKEIDFSTATYVQLNIIAGKMMAMSLRYAGSGDKTATQTILLQIKYFRSLKVVQSEKLDDPQFKSSIDQYQLFQLLSQSVLCLGLINAGSCDINCIKICRIIRKKLQDSSLCHYGFNMAINMALGFICLGNGSYSFNLSNLSIAALLISVYPNFPNLAQNNKYHLQALRNFYVLAIEQRQLHAVEVNGNQEINIDIELINQNNQSDIAQTPILIQDYKKISKISIKNDEYYTLQIPYQNFDIIKKKIIYVQQKPIQDLDFYKLLKSIFQKKSLIIDEKIQNYLLQNQDLLQLKPIQNDEQLQLESYEQILKEDIQEYLELYIDIIVNKNIYLIQNVKILQNFFKTQNSKIFQSIFLENFFKKLQEPFIQFNQYFNIPDLCPLSYITNDNFAQFQILLQWCLINSIPNKQELMKVKQFFNHINIHKQSQTRDKIIHLCQLSLNISFPQMKLQAIEEFTKNFLKY